MSPQSPTIKRKPKDVSIAEQATGMTGEQLRQHQLDLKSQMRVRMDERRVREQLYGGPRTIDVAPREKP